MRERGIPILQHPLADTLFLVDGWVNDRVFSLFIGNSEFRSSDGGRKDTAREVLGDAAPPFEFLPDMVLPAASVFGRVHLPTRAAVDAYIEQLSASASKAGT